VATIIITYFLLQLEKLRVQQPFYSLLNMLGALLIFNSLAQAWNWAAALIEIFWMLISLFGY
jgi:hypothetical protein